MYPRLAWNLLQRQGWLQTHRDLPIFASQLLRLKVYTTMPGLKFFFFLQDYGHLVSSCVNKLCQKRMNLWEQLF